MFYHDVLSVNPFREMDRIQREMNRLFEDVTTTRSRAFPAVNLWSNEEAAAITAELPGYTPDEVQLSIVGDMLTIKGSRRQPELKEGDQLHRQERIYGNFERSIRLPFAIKSEKVEARFQNGILNILLPRAEEDKPKKIEIKSR